MKLSVRLQSSQAYVREDILLNSFMQLLTIDNKCFLIACYTESLSFLLAVDQKAFSISSHVSFFTGKLTAFVSGFH